jgi:hypothetical protein
LATVVIHLEGQPDAYGSRTHQFRNFGETVFKWVSDNGFGVVDIGEVDRSTTRFAVTGVKTSKVRRVTHWVEEEASRQFLTISTEVL